MKDFGHFFLAYSFGDLTTVHGEIIFYKDGIVIMGAGKNENLV